MYRYDRLGRLVSRRPWTDSMAVKDSMVYDVAGNLKKTITRRGHAITTDYDSRNRDTLTVIPGVGTLRKQYGGPQDQVTRQWYDNPVDSIGGINGEVRLAYDSRGRLRADTSYIGTSPQGTIYTYDSWDRVGTMTDPVGTWTTGYETLRGYADTLITPLGDTLTYVHDGQGRAVGPYIRSGGLRHWSEPGWNPNESLDSLGTMTQGVGGSFISGRYVRPNPTDDGYLALEPVWVEQHGVGMAVDSLDEVVAYDGWERLTSWAALKNGVAVAAETYLFDQAGNISQASGAATYDIVTNRLTSRVEPGGNRLFGYDRAGNLIQQTKLSTGEVRTFDYDALNRLVTVRRDGALMARYAYDVLDRRIAKRVYSSASDGVPGYTRFIYHGDNVAFQADSAGAMGLRFTWGLGTDDLRAVTDAAGQHYYIVQDKLGSVRGLFERSGAWRVSVRFSPYGDLVAIDSAGARPAIWHGWTGREFDEETGWFYHRARYYSPLVRRYVQEDPIGYGGGTNLYAYVDGRPLEAIDPNGTAAQSPDDARVAGAGGLSLRIGAGSGSVSIDGVAVSGGAAFLGGAGFTAASNSGFYSIHSNVPRGSVFGSGGCQQRGNCTQSQVMESRADYLRRTDVIVSTDASPLFLLGGIQKAQAGAIRGFTKEGFERMWSRDGVGVSTPAMFDAVRHPLDIISQSGGRLKYIGRDAVVVLNGAGRVITTWATNRKGWRYR